jgi:hypothetical protein
MADIFVSYKKEDAGRVERIVEGLRAEGFTVWWDHAIAPGAQWDQTIQRELADAKMVIAVWSKLSVDAPWVKEEAAIGKQKGKLLPVRIDEVDPPLGFGLIQMADLIGWSGDRSKNPKWDHFLSAVKAVFSGQAMPGLERPVRRRSPLPLVIGLLVGLAVLGGGGWWAWQQIRDVQTVTVDYDSGSTTTVTRTPSGQPSAGQPAAPSANEQALFDKAQESRLKSDYQDYLRSFPDGAFSRRVREEILPLCTVEMRKVWETQGPYGQQLRAGSASSAANGDLIQYESSEKACASAKDAYQQQVDLLCRNFAATNGRNPQLSIKWVDCSCQQAGGSWWCFNDSTYACTWEQEIDKGFEVCG